MASINKESVREEVVRIKSEFDRLSVNKQVNDETKALIQSMFMLINLLVFTFLEKITKKNNKNSNKPSSQMEKDNSAITNQETNGKGKMELKKTTYNTRTIESSTIISASKCSKCGQKLTESDLQHYEQKTKIDIVFEKVVENVDVGVKSCSNCNKVVKGEFPQDMVSPLQYGNGLKAYIINLLISQMISLNRIQKLIKTLIGEILYEATLLKFIFRFNQVLKKWEHKALEEPLRSSVMHVDETSLKVGKKNNWIHVYSAHDCWASYLSYNNCEHSLCESHLTRELTHIVESNEYSWDTRMKELLLATCKKIFSRKGKKPRSKEYLDLQKQYIQPRIIK